MGEELSAGTGDGGIEPRLPPEIKCIIFAYVKAAWKAEHQKKFRPILYHVVYYTGQIFRTLERLNDWESTHEGPPHYTNERAWLKHNWRICWCCDRSECVCFRRWQGRFIPYK